MKKLTLLIAIATASLSHQAFAQSKNFEGFSVGLNANFNNMKTDITSESFSASSTTAGIKAAYGIAMSNNFILGLAASYDTGSIKGGTNAAGTTSMAGKGLTVLSVEPGLKMSNDTLVYAKLGYATVTGELSGAANGSDGYTGTAFGAGVRSMMNKNWSLDVEAQQVNFSAKNSAAAGADVKPSATVLSIGASYYFF